LASVADGAADSDGVSGSRAKGEHHSEVVVSISDDVGGSSAVYTVLTSGSDAELPASVSQADTVVSSRDLQGDGVAVSVGVVSGPSVLQEVVHCVQIDVVEVEPDGHGDGKRGVQSVVVVVVVVDEGLLTVGVVENTFKRVGGESLRHVEVVVNVTVEFVTDCGQLLTVAELQSAGSSALDVWVLVLQEYGGGESRGGAAFVEL